MTPDSVRKAPWDALVDDVLNAATPRRFVRRRRGKSPTDGGLPTPAGTD